MGYVIGCAIAFPIIGIVTFVTSEAKYHKGHIENANRRHEL